MGFYSYGLCPDTVHSNILTALGDKKNHILASETDWNETVTPSLEVHLSLRSLVVCPAQSRPTGAVLSLAHLARLTEA